MIAWLAGPSPWAILGAGLAYGLIHSLLASLRFKATLRGMFGSAVERWYRLVYNLIAFLTLLPVLALSALLPDHPLYTLPAPWKYLALAGQTLAVVALGVGLIQTGVWSFLGLSQALGANSTEPTSMAVHGLYRWVRHPLYTAGLLFIWLTPSMSANLLTLYLVLSAYLLVGAVFEERKLVREFGSQYLRYQERTPMLIPGFPRLRRPAG